MIRFNYPFEQDALAVYTGFLLQHKIDELSAFQLGIAYDYDIPLMQRLAGFSKEQLLELTKQGLVELLTYLSKGEGEKQINDSLIKWDEDQLEIVGKFEINVRDITFINEVRKRTLTNFIDHFTSDPGLQKKITQQLNQFVLLSNTAGIEAFVHILMQRITKQEKQLLEAQAIAKVGSFEWDLITQQSDYSPELRKIFGDFNKHEQWMEFVHPEDRERVRNSLEESFVSGSYNEEYRYIVDGEEKMIWSRGEVLFNKEGKAVLMRGTVQDVTEWRRMTKQLQDSLNEQSQLKLLNLYKDEFLNIASHELKTPLTSIKAFLQLTLTVEERQVMTQYLSKSLQHVAKLEKLIGDLLDTSKLNAGQLMYNKELFEVAELVQDVVGQASVNFPHRTIRVESMIPVTLKADKLRIEQVLTNLIDNGLKYSNDEVIVAVDMEGDRVCIHVEDHGIGISEENQKHLFNRFYRSPDVHFSHQGLGLGLYISAKIIESHGGEIAVKTEINKGSRFTICLPVIEFSSLNEKASPKQQMME